MDDHSEFIADNPGFVEQKNSMDFLSDNGGESYNLCHCEAIISYRFLEDLMRLTDLKIDWSNFEIADMDFWRGEAYQAFFQHLESKGGFYYEVCPGLLWGLCLSLS